MMSGHMEGLQLDADKIKRLFLIFYIFFIFFTVLGFFYEKHPPAFRALKKKKKKRKEG
jgi:hypothetical protein